MAPDFGAQEDGGKRACRRYPNHVKDFSPERGNKMGECLGEVLDVGEEM